MRLAFQPSTIFLTRSRRTRLWPNRRWSMKASFATSITFQRRVTRHGSASAFIGWRWSWTRLLSLLWLTKPQNSTRSAILSTCTVTCSSLSLWVCIPTKFQWRCPWPDWCWTLENCQCLVQLISIRWKTRWRFHRKDSQSSDSKRTTLDGGWCTVTLVRMIFIFHCNDLYETNIFPQHCTYRLEWDCFCKSEKPMRWSSHRRASRNAETTCRMFNCESWRVRGGRPCWESHVIMSLLGSEPENLNKR